MDNLEEYLIKKGQRAKNAARVLSTLDTNCKNKVLLTMAKSLEDNIESIIKANSIDIKTW